MILAKTFLDKFHLKPSEAAFSTVSFRGNFRPEVDGDVISGVVIYTTGVKVHVKFGDSRSTRSLNIRLPHVVTNNHHHDDDNDDAGVCRSSHNGLRITAFCLETIHVQCVDDGWST